MSAVLIKRLAMSIKCVQMKLVVIVVIVKLVSPSMPLPMLVKMLTNVKSIITNVLEHNVVIIQLVLIAVFDCKVVAQDIHLMRKAEIAMVKNTFSILFPSL